MLMFVIFGAVLLLMLLGVSTAVTMGFASIATFLFAGGDPTRLFLVPQRMFAQVSGITLMSIPFFLLMGNLMTVGGVSKSLFGFGRVCLGHRWGGLSNAAIVACVVMAAMSGSAAACAAGIGMIAINEMTKSGYGRPFSCATIAAGGALGPIIPPSITLILYAGLTQTSVNSLFAPCRASCSASCSWAGPPGSPRAETTPRPNPRHGASAFRPSGRPSSRS